MSRPRLLPSVLVLLLAGCAQPEAPDDPQTSDIQGTDTGAAVAVPVDAALGNDTPLLLAASMGPEAPLASYRWTIPDGAIVESVEDGRTYRRILFDLVPVYPDGVVSPAEFGIFTFRLSEEAQLAGSIVGVPTRSIFIDPINSGSNSDELSEPQLEPRRLGIAAADLEAGDALGFVVAARDPQAAPFSLLLSPRLSSWQEGEVGPQTADQLLANRTAAALQPTYNGAGFQLARYNHYRRIDPGMAVALWWTLQAGPVDVQATAAPDAMRGAVPVESVEVTVAFPEAGFSRSFASLVSYQYETGSSCPAAGRYEVATNLHGAAAGHRTLLTQTALSETVLGLPYVSATGNGDGPATTSLKFDVANACSLAFGTLSQTDLGATTDVMFGLPALAGAAAVPGLVGPLPLPLARADLVEEIDGVRMEWVAGAPRSLQR